MNTYNYQFLDNQRMFEELRFHHSESANIQAEKNAMKNALDVARREVSILTEKEVEYANQAHRYVWFHVSMHLYILLNYCLLFIIFFNTNSIYLSLKSLKRIEIFA